MQTKLANIRYLDVVRIPHPDPGAARQYRKYRVTWIPTSLAPSGMLIELRRETHRPDEANYAKCRPDMPVEWLASDQDENPLPFPPG